MASTDLIARFATKPTLLGFVDDLSALSLPKCDTSYRMIAVIRDYPWQITVNSVHPAEVDLSAMVSARGGTIVTITTADS